MGQEPTLIDVDEAKSASIGACGPGGRGVDAVRGGGEITLAGVAEKRVAGSNHHGVGRGVGAGGRTGAGGFGNAAAQEAAAARAAGRPGQMGPMGPHGQRGEGEEDTEHQRPDYLVEADPDAIFGTDQRTSPPVIGE